MFLAGNPAANKCDRCGRLGMNTLALWDAPIPEGPWAYLCHAHFLRLPATHRQAARWLQDREVFADEKESR